MKLVGEVVEIKEGNIKGQKIVEVNLGEGRRLVYDLIGDLMDVSTGDNLLVEILESKPENLDSYDFCGHGYLVTSEDEVNASLISLWGIIFKFTPPLGLELDKKYYVCLRKVKDRNRV